MIDEIALHAIVLEIGDWSAPLLYMMISSVSLILQQLGDYTYVTPCTSSHTHTHTDTHPPHVGHQPCAPPPRYGKMVEDRRPKHPMPGHVKQWMHSEGGQNPGVPFENVRRPTGAAHKNKGMTTSNTQPPPQLLHYQPCLWDFHPRELC